MWMFGGEDWVLCVQCKNEPVWDNSWHCLVLLFLWGCNPELLIWIKSVANEIQNMFVTTLVTARLVRGCVESPSVIICKLYDLSRLVQGLGWWESRRKGGRRWKEVRPGGRSGLGGRWEWPQQGSLNPSPLLELTALHGYSAGQCMLGLCVNIFGSNMSRQ